MEIKRRITKLASRLSPQIEVMNVATEMSRMLDRFEELVNYAQEKIDRAVERKGNTIGKQSYEARAAADKVVSDHQTAESDENLRDQKESFDERNKIVEKSQKPEDLRTEMEKTADEEAQASRDERGASKEEDIAILADEHVVETPKPAKKKKRRSSK